jgi:hypothetical protein
MPRCLGHRGMALTDPQVVVRVTTGLGWVIASPVSATVHCTYPVAGHFQR